MERSWKWRVETDRPVTPLLATVVINGGLWWLSDGEANASTNQGFVRGAEEATGLDSRLVVMVVPGSLLNSYDLKVGKMGLHLGRSAVEVRANAREIELPHWPGADEIVINVDAERGVLLRWIAYAAGSAYASAAFVQISFDRSIPADIFAFMPTPEMKVRRFDGATVLNP